MTKPSFPHPPRFWLRFFRWFCHPDLVTSIEGDLLELYQERRTKSGKRMANAKLALDVLLLLRPAIIRPPASHPVNHYAMFRNYFKTGLRNILKYKMFSFISVFGLALAMSVSMLIILMIGDQKRYDAFHVHKDRVYRLLSDYKNSRQAYSTTAVPLAKVLKDDYPAIEEATALTPGPGGEAMFGQRVAEMRGYFADPAFFKVFSFDLVSGDKNSALTAPRSVVLSTTVAANLFGTENPIGKTIEFSDRQFPFPHDYGNMASNPSSWGSFTVTGVIDEAKYKSHLHYGVLMSASTRPQLVAEKRLDDRSTNWESFHSIYTYAMLKTGKDQAELDTILARIAAQHCVFATEEFKEFKLTSQALPEVQFDLKANDTDDRLPRIGYYFLVILAAVIMLSACLNYTNLSVARALTRAKEIGVRKVTGALRKDLVFQFISESILTALLAMALGVVMLMGIKPAFRGLWVNQYLNFELPDSVGIYAAFFGFALAVGIVAGLYPAWKLSGYLPSRALKNLDTARRSGLGMRKVLSVSQFVISLFFITTSLLIFRQFKYFLEFDYGFASANVVNVEMQGANYDKILHAFSTVPGIASVAASDIIPSTGRNNGTQVKKAGDPGEFQQVGQLIVNENFLETLTIPILAGKSLSRPVSDSLSNEVVVNRAMMLQLGFRRPDEILGTVLESKWDKALYTVVGVTEDFRYNLLINRSKVDPLMMRNVPREMANILVKISSPDSRTVVGLLEKKWKEIDPSHTFRYRFYDEQIAATHQGIFDLVSILGFIALLAVTIACLGLLGMATYTAERRKKEVGIRKVLGAESRSIMILLSKEFFRIVIVAVTIAAPLSYFVNNLWLQYLPTRVEFGYQTVLLGTVIMVLLGLITITSQTLRASRANPVDALKVD